MTHYTVELTEDEMAFFRQLFDSQLAVSIQNVELVAALKQKMLNTRPDPAVAPDVAG